MNIERKAIEQLTQEQSEKLETLRNKKRFDPSLYVEAKSLLLHSYLKRGGINSCVVGISGGIDSAVVLALLLETQKLGQLENIVPICLPAVYSDGVTNQRDVIEKAARLCKSLNQELSLVDISRAIERLGEDFLPDKGSNWAEGQSVSVMRIPYFNYAATLLADKGNKAIIIGTTNRSEAGLGYMGKYSDLVVDVQLITDLWKSEVFSVAEELNLPEEILNAIPRGDVYDGSVDEEIFGASYDAVELHLQENIKGKAGENIEALRKFNAHKFLVGTQAVHLDIQESGVEDGWPLQFESKYWKNLEKQGDIIKPCFVAPVNFTKINFSGQEERNGKFLSASEVEQLKDIYYNAKKKEANVFGYVNNPSAEVGSFRASFYNVELAKEIWSRLSGEHKGNLYIANDPLTDWEEGEMYVPVGINPLFRYIGYEKQGASLNPHYDYSFKDGDYKSLTSVIIYLTTNETGGTIFYNDKQGNSWEKNLGDLTKEQGGKLKIKETILPEAGTSVTFPHYLLHGGDEVIGETKIIMRTDIMFEKVKHSGNK
jgi:NAD+ synthetase